MSLYSVAALKMQITGLGMKPQINTISIVSDNVLGTRIMSSTTTHQFVHPVNIEGRNQLGKGHVLCNSSRHTDLIDGQIRIGGNDCTCTEIHTFTH